MVYFKFLSEITDIGLRINFKESGVKFTRWITRFSDGHCRPNDVKKYKVLKFELVMLGRNLARKWGGRIIQKKTCMLFKQILNRVTISVTGPGDCRSQTVTVFNYGILQCYISYYITLCLYIGCCSSSQTVVVKATENPRLLTCNIAW